MNMVKEKHIVCYLVIAPLNQASYLLFDGSVYQKTGNVFLERLKKKYPGLNLIDQPAFLPNSLFGDMNHMNQKGSVMFTNQIKNVIK